VSYYVYILECADGNLYTGVTNNLKRRFQEHQEGRNPGSYTSVRRPLELKWFGEFTDVKEAIAKEKQIKRWSWAKKRALMNSDWKELAQRSKKRFGGKE